MLYHHCCPYVAGAARGQGTGHTGEQVENWTNKNSECEARLHACELFGACVGVLLHVKIPGRWARR